MGGDTEVVPRHAMEHEGYRAAKCCGTCQKAVVVPVRRDDRFEREAVMVCMSGIAPLEAAELFQTLSSSDVDAAAAGAARSMGRQTRPTRTCDSWMERDDGDQVPFAEMVGR